jgi:hypothetical protein
LVVSSIDVGTIGAGKGTGFSVMIPPTITASMIGSFSAYGMIGTMGVPLATGVAQGFTTCFMMAVINTVSVGVGVGAGKIMLVPNPAASLSIFLAALAGVGMSGVSMPRLAAAISTGLDQVLPSAIGIVAIAGPPSPYPSSGVGLGKLL